MDSSHSSASSSSPFGISSSDNSSNVIPRIFLSGISQGRRGKRNSGAKTKLKTPAYNKLGRGNPIGSQTKKILLNIFHKLKTCDNNLATVDVVKTIADLSGVSKCSINKIRKEMDNKGVVRTRGKHRHNGHKRRAHIYDNFTKTAIRCKVHDLYRQNEIPTLQKLQQVIQDDEQLPNLKRTALRMFLHDIGFKFMRHKQTAALIEREDVTAWRRRYLRQIRQYRRDGKKIYYCDETWVNTGQYVEHEWIGTNITSYRQAFLSGLTTGLKHPTSKGDRLIIGLIGSDTGFVTNSLLVFKAKKSHSDYYAEMSSENFMKWMENVFPNLEPGSVIVIDNAPYHSVKLYQAPTMAWQKDAIQQWCIDNNAHFEENYLKSELLEVVAAIKGSDIKYVFDERAKELGFQILRLPPYHCCLNPIEMIWSQIKNFIASKNTFKINDIQQLLIHAINEVTHEQWYNYTQHVVKEENNFWNVDHLIEDKVEKLIINTTEDSSDSDSDFHCDDSDFRCDNNECDNDESDNDESINETILGV